MKKKILMLFICILMVSGCTLFDKKEKIEVNETNETKLEYDEILIDTDNITKVSEDDNSAEINLHKKLNDYAEKLYESKDYLNFQKRNGIYFISLTELNDKYNFDISEFKDEANKICDVNNSGIFIDVDNSLNLDYPENTLPIVVVLSGCFDKE